MLRFFNDVVFFFALGNPDFFSEPAATNNDEKSSKKRQVMQKLAGLASILEDELGRRFHWRENF